MRVLIGASVTVVSLLIGVSLAGASSPWLPEKGHTDLSVGVIYEEFDQFWRGGQRRAFPPGKFKQVSTVVSVEHGLFEDISLDLTVGYVRAYGDPRTNDGLMDTTLGIKYRVLDEFEWDSPLIPSIAFRFGGIIEGTYKASGVDFPGIPGDKASGIEGEIALAKLLPLDFGVMANLGIRD